jgi:hypothetical protein
MSFHQQGWSARFQSMGDEAEAMFEQVTPLGSVVRFGWNRQALHKFMSKTLSHKPDYYANQGILVEVIGCSGDLVRAMKVDKWEAMKVWHKIQPLQFFVWNRANKTWLMVPYNGMRKTIARSVKEERVKAFENDGNQYYEMEWEWLAANASERGVIE